MRAEIEKCSRTAIKIADSIVNTMALCLILLTLAFGGYAIWDASNVVNAAEAKQYEIYKPTDDPVSFQKLQTMNPDVFAWLYLYDTPINYPLLQAKDNSKYINTDAMGTFSLTGALFLDYQNQNSFEDFNSIIYGHNMVPSVMFGGIKEFKDKSYFEKHKFGSLYFDGVIHGVELFAIVEADAYDDFVFSPAIKGEDRQKEYLRYMLSMALHSRDIGVTIDDRIVLFSTCSTSSTNGRDILMGRIVNNTIEDTLSGENASLDAANDIEIMENESIRAMIPVWGWVVIAATAALIIVVVIYQKSTRGK